ncbi:hypothetical protein [Photobacterium damselae]|uniref:hypothetical protein n=1 Tax=Photobacterium damselae TaxID=38293 RepID=UPI004069164A
MSSNEVLASTIVGKERREVPCEHTHTICTGTGKNQSCTTFNDHLHDYDWILNVSDKYMGDIKIKRVDSQGYNEPPLYQSAKIGDIAFKTHSYTDYIKANENSLFNYVYEAKELETDPVFKNLPVEPTVYEQYKYNRIVVLGNVTNAERVAIADWKNAFDKDLKILSSKLQTNVVVVVGHALDDSLYHKIIVKWNGGAKNDIILFYNIDESGKVSWFRSTSFMSGYENNKMHSLLRMESLGKTFDMHLYAKTIDVIEKNFHRHSMEQERAQLDSYSAPWWMIALCLFAGCGSGVFLSKQFERHDVLECIGAFCGIFVDCLEGMLRGVCSIFKIFD